MSILSVYVATGTKLDEHEDKGLPEPIGPLSKSANESH